MDQGRRIQISVMQADTGDLTVFIGGVVINALCCVAATGVNRFFIKITDFYTSLRLCYSAKNVKDLADAGRFTVFG